MLIAVVLSISEAAAVIPDSVLAPSAALPTQTSTASRRKRTDDLRSARFLVVEGSELAVGPIEVTAGRGGFGDHGKLAKTRPWLRALPRSSRLMIEIFE